MKSNIYIAFFTILFFSNFVNGQDTTFYYQFSKDENCHYLAIETMKVLSDSIFEKVSNQKICYKHRKKEFQLDGKTYKFKKNNNIELVDNTTIYHLLNDSLSNISTSYGKNTFYVGIMVLLDDEGEIDKILIRGEPNTRGVLFDKKVLEFILLNKQQIWDFKKTRTKNNFAILFGTQISPR